MTNCVNAGRFAPKPWKRLLEFRNHEDQENERYDESDEPDTAAG